MAQAANTTHLRNVAATVTAATAGEARVTHISINNSSAAVAWVQFFDSTVANVTLGTTRPMFQIPVAATSGNVEIDYASPIKFNTLCAVASATASEGGTGSAAGVMVNVWID